MGPRKITSAHLHAKDMYNRISLQKTWSNTIKKIGKLKFGRLRMEYGDSRVFFNQERNKLNTEGLKI